MRILLVIPCLNESGRIEPFLVSLKEALQGDSELRVLVVDDGSSKQEQRQLSDIVEKHRVGWGSLCSLHCLEVNRGKGGAVYAGWATAVDEQLLGFVDADGSCDAQSVKLLIEMARRQSAPCALFGSRVKMLGIQIERTWKRHLIGRFFAILVGSLLGIPVYDSQCGLKILHRSSYESVRLKLKLEGFAFDVELISALWGIQCKMLEVPISWHEVAGGKVRIIRDSIRMLSDVIKIRSMMKRVD